ncbi:MAG: zinc-dependent alcohol dehydrogenase [Acidimicrobiales bacterium]
MKAARLQRAGEIAVVDEPRPVPLAGESLVRVSTVGICGSDLHWFREASIGDARLEQALALGHEFGGVVEGGPLGGRRVAVDPAAPCGTCERCREGNENLCPYVRFAGHGITDGGLREYISWPTALLQPVPEGLSDAAVALLEPLGVALHAIDLGHLRFGGSVAVVGCGPIGLLMVQIARAAGCASVTAVEPLAHRRTAASQCGADLVLSPEQAKGDVGGVDVAFEAAGDDDAVASSMALVRPGGRVVLAGIPDDDTTRFPSGLARRKGLTIAMVRRMKNAYPRAISLAERKVIALDLLVSHRFPLGEAAAAFRFAAGREGLKTVVDVTSP